jgi:hypothetical protein
MNTKNYLVLVGGPQQFFPAEIRAPKETAWFGLVGGLFDLPYQRVDFVHIPT